MMRRTRRGVEIRVGLLSIELPCENRSSPRGKGVFRNVDTKSGKLIRMSSRLRKSINVFLRKQFT